MERRAFGLQLDRRSVSDDGEYATFKGYASTFGNEDSYGDVLEPGAFAKTITAAGSTLPMLWQHATDEVIGVYPRLAENSSGLAVTGRIALATQRGREAYTLLKMGAIKSMSIGFTIPDGKADFDQATQTRRIREVRLWEISLVTFPANAEAAITSVKRRQSAQPVDPLIARFGRIVGELERRHAEEAAPSGSLRDRLWAIQRGAR
jgi:hypothetical protein